VWQFLANARVVGIEKARAAIARLHALDREPFPSLYEMFAEKDRRGRLVEMEKKALATMRPYVLRALLRRAERGSPRPQDAARNTCQSRRPRAQVRRPRGPGYMGQVGAVHYEAMVGNSRAYFTRVSVVPQEDFCFPPPTRAGAAQLLRAGF